MQAPLDPPQDADTRAARGLRGGLQAACNLGRAACQAFLHEKSAGGLPLTSAWFPLNHAGAVAAAAEQALAACFASPACKHTRQECIDGMSEALVSVHVAVTGYRGELSAELKQLAHEAATLLVDAEVRFSTIALCQPGRRSAHCEVRAVTNSTRSSRAL